MSDGYRMLALRIIGQGYEDISTFHPDDIDYLSADEFFKSHWFETIALSCGYDTSVIIKAVNKVKSERAQRWYSKLSDIEKAAAIAEAENRIANTDKIVFAWEKLA